MEPRVDWVNSVWSMHVLPVTVGFLQVLWFPPWFPTVPKTVYLYRIFKSVSATAGLRTKHEHEQKFGIKIITQMRYTYDTNMLSILMFEYRII